MTMVWIILQIQEFPLKNHSAQSLANNLWAFFHKLSSFVRHHFVWVLYLSILDGVFVMCYFCKVPLFSNGIKGCFLYWVLFLLGVSGGAVSCFYS